jgi:hypothetical protein
VVAAIRSPRSFHQGSASRVVNGGAHEGLGVVAAAQGRHEAALAALAAFDAGIDRYERLGDPARAGELRAHRSAALRALGRGTEAEAEAEAGTGAGADARR